MNLKQLNRRANRPLMRFAEIERPESEPKRPVFGDYSEQLVWEREQAEDAAAEIEQSKTPRRSAMNAKDKAAYIGAHGGAAYLALPW